MSSSISTDRSGQDTAAVESALAEATEGRFTVHDMRLRVGDRIQLQPPAAIGKERFLVRLLGYLEHGSLLVTAPTLHGLRVPIRERDRVVARVFSSQNAFGFDCTVLRVCKIPYDYLHLSFPEAIQGAVVRKSPRIRTRIIAAVAPPDESAEKVSAVIVNLSADGALVKARRPLAEKDQEIGLSFRVLLHEVEVYLSMRAVVRNAYLEENGSDRDDALRHCHGVQFLALQPNDRMVLQSLIYQQMIEQPHTMA